MDRYHRLKSTRTISKSVTFGVILLTIGASIIPCITRCIVTASDPNNRIQVTAQVYEDHGFKDITVQLTKDQYRDLEQYLIHFRSQLNQTTTREAAVPLFKEAVRQLNKYTLLPRETSIERINNLMVANTKDVQHTTMLRSTSRISDFLNQTNAFCLIAGETTMNTRFFGFLERGCSGLCWILYYLTLLARRNDNDTALLNTTLTFVKSLRNMIYTINAKRIIGTGMITFGNSHPATIPPPYRYDPAQGWITSLGLLGKKSWNGTFFGRLLLMAPFNSDSYVFYPGAVGFVGIKLNLRDGTFFLGSSALVSIK